MRRWFLGGHFLDSKALQSNISHFCISSLGTGSYTYKMRFRAVQV